MTDWTAACVTCAARDRSTPLESGHVCLACAQRILDHLSAIGDLVAMATVEPMRGKGGTRTVPASRPPINVDGLDPELTLVTLTDNDHRSTVLDICEAWCRLIREDRELAPYGVATEDHASTRQTLTEALRFLRAQVEWVTTATSFPVEDFAHEIAACVRSLRKWDADARMSSYEVSCPADREEGTCGCVLRITVSDVSDTVTCRRCRATWSVAWLMRVVATDHRAHVWVDVEAASERFGVDRKTLQRWVREGRITKQHNMYDVKPLLSPAAAMA
jgi:hypothetical protein